MEKVDFLKKIIEAIGITFDLDSVLDIICRELLILFNADIVGIASYAKTEGHYGWSGLSEYRANPSITSLYDFSFSKQFQVYLEDYILEKGQDIIIDNIQESNQLEFFKEEYTLFGTKSIINIPIKRGNDKWGILGIFQDSYYRHWTEEEIELLHTVIDYIYVAIKQAELYNSLKQTTATQNAFINNMPFMAWLKDDQSKLLVVNEQFGRMANMSIENIIGKTDLDFFPRELAEKYRKDDLEVMKTRHSLSTEEQIAGPKGTRWHETFKSPVLDDKGNIIGTVGFAKDITERKEAELELLRKQEQIIKANERERLLRNIIETVRSTLDINETKTTIVNQIGKALNADRVFIVEFAPETDIPLVLDKYSEYLSSPELKSLVGFDFASSKVSFFSDIHKQTKSVVISDVQEFIKENNLQNTEEEKWLSEMNLKTGIGMPIYYGKNVFGVLAIHYTKVGVLFTDEQMEFIRTLADQMGIALYQARLFEKEKQTAGRESFLRQIMLSSISSLDIKDIINNIVFKTGEIFEANRCFFIPYDLQKKEYLTIEDYEVYISSPDISTVSGLKFTHGQMAPFEKYFFELREVLAVSNIHNLELTEETKQLLESFDIKSFIFIPVYYRDIFLGVFVCDYIKNHKIFSQVDKDMLSAIGNQSAIAIYQAKLFDEIQDSKNKETLLKTITNEILISNNIEEAYYKIAAQLSKTFDIDRTALSLYDPVLKKLSNLIGEYRKNENIPSIKTDEYLFTKDFEKIVNDELVEKKRILFIDNVNDPQYPELFRHYLNKSGAKSTVWVPLIYQDKFIAVIFLTNTESYKTLSESEKNLLHPIAQQIALGINLFKFADEVNRSLSIERSLREIVTTARQSKTHDQLFSYELENIIKIFNVDRAIHLHHYTIGKISIINESIKEEGLEFLKNGIILNKENTKELVVAIFNRAMIINDVNKDIQNTELKNYLLKNEIIAFVIYPTENIYSDKIEKPLGATMICSKTPRIWTSNEIETFKLIIDTTALVYQEIKQRKESEELKQTFLATLTHDLRSPINAEQKALEAIISQKLGTSLEDFCEYLRDIYNINEELLRIVNNILSVYHYESGKVELKLELYNIKDIIEDSVKSLIHLAKDQGSEINTNIQSDLPLIKIDRNEIFRVITNLLSNAVKHNKKGTNISISANKIDNEIQVAVHDNGKGIPESEKPNIFQRYPTTARKVGTGLGLYLSKQIVDAHHGKIWFDTDEGKGTTFYFTLPIA